MDTTINQTHLNGLQLFKSLIKDGCVWSGDVVSAKWAEVLDIPDEYVLEKVKQSISYYTADVDYRLKGHMIFVA